MYQDHSYCVQEIGRELYQNLAKGYEQENGHYLSAEPMHNDNVKVNGRELYQKLCTGDRA